MSHRISPWCLHWERDGELEISDRQDLFLTLTSSEAGRIQQLLLQATRVTSHQPNPMTRQSA